MPKTLQISGGLFESGKIVATPGALALADRGVNLIPYLARHLHGDWGDLTEEDQRENDLSVKKGYRILSSYVVAADGTKLWIITERDRSVTTMLLPEEY